MQMPAKRKKHPPPPSHILPVYTPCVSHVNYTVWPKPEVRFSLVAKVFNPEPSILNPKPTLGLQVRQPVAGFRVEGSGELGFRVEGLGDQGLGFRV